MLEEYFKQLKNLKLSSAERASMRQYLVNYVTHHPVRKLEVTRHGQQKSNSSFLSLVLRKQYMSAIIIVLIAVLGGGGVSYAAEASLPGDVLYPVKIKVNEELRAAFSFNEEAKASWEIRRAERRLEEAERLTASGRLSAEVMSNIQANFEAHADRVKARIAKFENRDDDNNDQDKRTVGGDLSSRFEISLRVHEGILERFATSTATRVEIKAEIDKLRVQVKARADEQVKIRLKLQEELNDSGSTRTMPVACVQVVTRARNPQTGEVREFSTPCDVPTGWEVILNSQIQTEINGGALNPSVECESCTYSNPELRLGL